MKRSQIEEARPFYEEGGRSVGELLAYFPGREPDIWKAVGGAGLWKRYYLEAFRILWQRENPKRYDVIKTCRRSRRLTLARQADKLETCKREASLEAMLTPDLPASWSEAPKTQKPNQ